MSEAGPLNGWSFANAYPVKWEIAAFNSTRPEIAVESFTLSYAWSNRINLLNESIAR